MRLWANMNYNEAQQFLLSLSNIPRKEYMSDPKHCDWYLKRIQFFLDSLGNPEKKIPHYIHVTGTSGKGSVCAFLHSILRAAGARVGSIESPHPTYLMERWKVGDRIMLKGELARLVSWVKPKLDEYSRATPYDMLPFSELMTVLGFLYLVRQRMEWAVVEAGCGGRYDSTNVMPWKDAAIITNVGLDHTEILGNTRAKIAYEKAGIIKKGVAVFTMERDQKILRIFEREARKAGAKGVISNFPPCRGSSEGGQFPCRRQSGHGASATVSNLIETNLDGTRFEYKGKIFQVKAMGEHQVKNAILCIEVARHLGISEAAIAKGLAEAEQPLRMEVVRRGPLVILDSAHNPDKIKTTTDSVRLLFNNEAMKQWNNAHLVIGFSNDKNVLRMLTQLSALNPQSIACTRNTINPFRKAASPRLLAEACARLMPKAKTQSFLDPVDALNWSRARADKDDIILVTGSIFLSGELRGKLGERAA